MIVGRLVPPSSWDLAFHCVVLAHIDPSAAKHQLLLLGREWFMHPNGQLRHHPARDLQTLHRDGAFMPAV